MFAVAPLTVAEVRGNFACLESEDYREDLRAFGEKRKPSFSGR